MTTLFLLPLMRKYKPYMRNTEKYREKKFGYIHTYVHVYQTHMMPPCEWVAVYHLK